MDDLRIADVDFLTIGQYLQPTVKHAAVDRFVTPDEFAEYAALARAQGLPAGLGHAADPQLLPRRRRFRRAARRARAAALPLMPTHAEKQIVPYPPEQLFDLVADVGKYPRVPAVVRRRPRAQPHRAPNCVADLTIGFGPFRESFTSRVTLDRPRPDQGALRKRSVPLSEQPLGLRARTPAAPRSISSSISNFAAASCRPRSAWCSTRRCAAW